MMKFTKEQTRLLTVCVALYTVLYSCRLNMSAALDAITQELEISIATGGLLQTVFALVYACGQIVNGSVADRVNPFRYMILGLCGSALCNMAAGMASGFPVLLVAWTANAVFQSMLWTPIVRIVAINFTGLQERNAANAALACVLIVGHFMAWAISGYMADHFSWRLSFLVPAGIAVISALIGASFMPELKQKSYGKAGKNGQEIQAAPLSALLTPAFLLVLATCIVYGFIRDGVITWTPTILAHIGRERAISSTAFTLVLPVINTIGISIGVWQRSRGANPRVVVATMMAASVACCACLLDTQGILTTAMMLGCICAAMYGANTMITGQIPLEFDVIGRTGTAAGLIDAFIYFGSALAGALAGGIYEHTGTKVLCLLWLAGSALAGVMILASGKRRT